MYIVDFRVCKVVKAREILLYIGTLLIITEPGDCLLFQSSGCFQRDEVRHLAKFMYGKEALTKKGRDLGVTNVNNSTEKAINVDLIHNYLYVCYFS